MKPKTIKCAFRIPSGLDLDPVHFAHLFSQQRCWLTVSVFYFETGPALAKPSQAVFVNDTVVRTNTRQILYVARYGSKSYQGVCEG